MTVDHELCVSIIERIFFLIYQPISTFRALPTALPKWTRMPSDLEFEGAAPGISEPVRRFSQAPLESHNIIQRTNLNILTFIRLFS